MRKGIAVSGAAVAALAATVVAAAPASASVPRRVPGPDGVTIEIATVNGSGCPAGTAAVAVSDDKEAFTVTYSDYMAVTGGSSSPTDFRKNCQINMKVHVPQGFTYAIAAADYRGFAYLQRGASAMERASYYFQGMPQTSAISHSLQGEFIDNWQFTDENDVAQLVYKPCGEDRNFNINTELRVFRGTSDPSKTSFISMDSTDGSIQTTYHFAWITCPRRQ
ncbi:uncharacterized protein DUF4360 [Actinomadura hallensis]|uniref:Uncharacterized protein DUF4360 n=1 Tax=Actinomadura hallensis TaxID=337895 RepID=A0A543IN08_9ACTN|nr:DUF4360 domain-containing protein [Actinomadura hallensis]TQM71951.1 uncharacterized protein DUF4360 [Actinomadura hallensis]HLV71962.1 DUF4360 domain-containing protein [Vulgatibacteraceae bacterium]